MISLPDDLASTCSSVLILEDPIKFQYTDTHNAKIFDCLQQLRANAKETNCFQLVVFHCDDIKQTEKLIKDAKRNIDDLFPKIFPISLSTKQLKQIVQIYGKTDSSNFFEKITEDANTSSIGHPLKLALFLRLPLYEPTEFCYGPIAFVLNELKAIGKSQSKNERILFTTLVRFILPNREMTRTDLEAILDQAVSDTLKDDEDRENLTRECIQQLLQRYIEKTQDGKSYKLIHDVITRCILFTCMKFDIHRDLVFKECDPSLLLNCIRPKTLQERIVAVGDVIFCHKTLDIALPTILFPSLVESFVQRNQMITMLFNVRFLENTQFKKKMV